MKLCVILSKIASLCKEQNEAAVRVAIDGLEFREVKKLHEILCKDDAVIVTEILGYERTPQEPKELKPVVPSIDDYLNKMAENIVPLIAKLEDVMGDVFAKAELQNPDAPEAPEDSQIPEDPHVPETKTNVTTTCPQCSTVIMIKKGEYCHCPVCGWFKFGENGEFVSAMPPRS